MKKWFYIFMLSLMATFGIIGCTSKDDEVRNGEANEDTPIHITIRSGDGAIS